MLPLCVIAGEGYDCEWTMMITNTNFVNDQCFAPYHNVTEIAGCVNFDDRIVLVAWFYMDKKGSDGMNVLWHEIRHAMLYSDCMAVGYKHHWSCGNYADWHTDWLK